MWSVNENKIGGEIVIAERINVILEYWDRYTMKCK